MSRPYRKLITRYVRFAPAFCRLFGCIPEILSRAARVNLNPSGANNTIRVTANTAGTAGNSLTASIVISSGSSLSVAETDGDVVITSGSGYAAVVTGTLTPDATGSFPYVGNDSNGRPLYGVGSIVSYPFSSLRFTVTSGTTGYWLLRYLTSAVNGSTWVSSTAEYATQVTPDLASDWEPGSALGAGASPEGTPAVSLTAATAAQALALSQASLSVTLTNAPGSDGTGVLAAVAQTPLTGGI